MSRKVSNKRGTCHFQSGRVRSLSSASRSSYFLRTMRIRTSVLPRTTLIVGTGDSMHELNIYSSCFCGIPNTIRIGTGHLLVGSGRLIGGNATLSLSGSYTQTGGIVTSQSTLTLSGSMSVTKPGSTTSPAPSFTSTGTVV